MTGEQENKIIAAIAGVMAEMVIDTANAKMDSAGILQRATDVFYTKIDDVISDFGYDRYNDGMAAEREVHCG